MELPPCHPCHPGGSLDTGGPGRAGTAGAEGHLLGWTGSEEAQSVGVGDGRCGAAGAAAVVRQVELEVLAESGWA